MIDEKVKSYIIPKNFIDESRILNGAFRTRYFIEGVILALIPFVLALLIPTKSMSSRITIVTSICFPFFLIGNMGINGDPVSTTLSNIRKWRKSRDIMIYNEKTLALKETPLSAMMAKELPGDKVLDFIDAYKESKRKKNAAMLYVEGQTFEFEEDSELVDLYADEVFGVQLEEQTEQADMEKPTISEENPCESPQEIVSVDTEKGSLIAMIDEGDLF